MTRSSGITLTKSDAKIVLGMADRGDRNHDIAAWFGVNQGRIAEVKQGDFGTLEMAPPEALPPSGPPGIKGRRLRAVVGDAVAHLEKGDEQAALKALKKSVTAFDANER